MFLRTMLLCISLASLTRRSYDSRRAFCSKSIGLTYCRVVKDLLLFEEVERTEVLDFKKRGVDLRFARLVDTSRFLTISLKGFNFFG